VTQSLCSGTLYECKLTAIYMKKIEVDFDEAGTVFEAVIKAESEAIIAEIAEQENKSGEERTSNEEASGRTN
jgi:hypothetical protein